MNRNDCDTFSNVTCHYTSDISKVAKAKTFSNLVNSCLITGIGN